jgi:hypothetical protein
MERKPIRTGYNKKGSPTKHYEQSDMKTSVLIQVLIKDRETNNRISVFLLEQITSICDSLEDYNETLHFNSYVQLLRGLDLKTTDTNKFNELQMKQANENSKIPIAYTDQYIPGWSKASTFDATSTRFRQNALAMYQYSKFTHILIFSSNFNIFFRIFLDIFQQNNFYFLSKLRGHRVDLNNDRDNPPLDNHIGISTFEYDYLLHKYTNDAGIQLDVPSWRHDGEVSCSIAYDNYYNNKKKLERLKNTYNGSLQCGISGSQQYILFAFLLSIIHRPTKLTKDDMDAACKNIFILSCMYLVGMGGHNIQEVLLGLTSSIIMLRTVFTDIIKNLGTVSGVNGSYDRVKMTSYYNNYPPDTDLIKNIIAFCFTLKYTDDSYNKPSAYDVDFKYSLIESTIHMVRECKPFVDYFYDLTTHVNVTGIFGSEINDIYFHSSKTINYSTNSYDTLDVRLEKMKQTFIDNYFKPQNMTDQQLQIFFSLEKNRYLFNQNKSFNQAGHNFMTFIKKDFPIVDDFIKKSTDTANIPFSFKSHPKHKSSSRKKSAKRKSPKRKSPKKRV